MDFNKIKEVETKVDNLSTQALLDKLSLSGVTIEKIDNPKNLESKGILTNSDSKFKFFTLDGQEFTHLSIKDDTFGILKAGVNFAKNGRTYANLSVNVKNDIGTNLVCNTVKDYKNQLDQIKEYLIKTYGVYASFENCFINSIEINKTFAISEDISAYRRVLQLIANNVPRNKRMNLMHSFEVKASNGLNTETIIITSRKSNIGKNGKTNKSKQYEELILYSKSNQIEKIIKLNREYMRVEVRIVSSAKIKKMLGTNRIADITDTLINDFYNKEINELIIKPFANWKENRDKEVLKIMQKQRLQDSQSWIVNTLLYLANEEIKNNIPTILDISEILPLIDYLNIEDRKRRYKIRVDFKKQAKKRATVFCNSDDKKMQEIIDNLQKKENKSVSPSVSPLLEEKAV